jgi:hypothetical protein
MDGWIEKEARGRSVGGAGAEDEAVREKGGGGGGGLAGEGGGERERERGGVGRIVAPSAGLVPPPLHLSLALSLSAAVVNAHRRPHCTPLLLDMI